MGRAVDVKSETGTRPLLSTVSRGLRSVPPQGHGVGRLLDGAGSCMSAVFRTRMRESCSEAEVSRRREPPVQLYRLCARRSSPPGCPTGS